MFNPRRKKLPLLTEAEEATYGARMFEVTLRNIPSDFPVRLTDALERSYKSAFLAYMNSLRTKVQRDSDSKETFSIITARRNRNADTDFVLKTHETGLSSVILANDELLKWYCRSKSGQFMEIKNFLEIETKDGVANPQYDRVRSIKAWNLGWGFDTYGCLSFYRSQIERDRVVHYVVYVERNIIERQSGNEVVVIE
jgi:hypothetical protein